MEEVIHFYGKVYHLGQVDKGHKILLGKPELMTSIMAFGIPDLEQVMSERDIRFPGGRLAEEVGDSGV